MESRRSKLSDLGGRTFMRAAKMAEIILLYVMYSAAAASAASAARSDYPVVNVRKLLRLQSEEKIERKNAFAQSRKMEMRAIIMTKKNPGYGTIQRRRIASLTLQCLNWKDGMQCQTVQFENSEISWAKMRWLGLPRTDLTPWHLDTLFLRTSVGPSVRPAAKIFVRSGFFFFFFLSCLSFFWQSLTQPGNQVDEEEERKEGRLEGTKEGRKVCKDYPTWTKKWTLAAAAADEQLWQKI
jgi:hypothetical protein